MSNDIERDYDHDKQLEREAYRVKGMMGLPGGMRKGKKRKKVYTADELKVINQPYYKKGEL